LQLPEKQNKSLLFLHLELLDESHAIIYYYRAEGRRCKLIILSEH